MNESDENLENSSEQEKDENLEENNLREEIIDKIIEDPEESPDKELIEDIVDDSEVTSDKELSDESIDDLEESPDKELSDESIDDLEESPDKELIENIVDDSEIATDEELSDEIIEDLQVITDEGSNEDIIDEIEGAIEEKIELDLNGEVIEGITSEQEDDDIEEGAIISEEFEESEEEKQARMEREIRDFHRNQIEASLYAAGKPLDVEELSTKLEIPKKEVRELINELAFDYLDRSTALVIAQMGERYQMQIKPEYTEKVSKFAKGGAIAEKYLRTLTIIALKQPIMKSMVIKLRGSGAYEHVKYLIDNALINGVKKGRSQELSTTDKYAEMFGLPKDKSEMKRVMIAQLGLDDQ